ncbi:MAG: M20 family metallopeptidase [Tractidigestivibacter sp.]|jgi:succinyl-diaminopimelate desuccinylase|uniref:M20 family metallopeptidase n=1 Tax=Tractidigestivibacter sp. TaxID=2847320 RepID=UPI003D8C1F88
MDSDAEATELTSRLVSIESTDPGTYEADVEGFVRSWLDEHIALAGKLAPEVRIEELEALPGRSCLRATIPARGDAGAISTQATDCPSDLSILCHMDTVREGAGWSEKTPAFSPTLIGDELYGRGSCDMKGGLACGMLAFSDALAEVGRRGELPRKSVSLVCTVDEEDLMRGSEAAIRAGWLGHSGWVMDLEPTGGAARGSHKGRTWFIVKMHGVTAHASTPWRGADAIVAAAEVITRVRAEVSAMPAHPELGFSTVTFGQIRGGYSPYVVPDECAFTIDLRLVPPTTTTDARALIEGAIRDAEKAVPGAHGELECTGDRPAIVLPQSSELLRALSAACEKVTGKAVETDVFTGYTDSAVVAGTCNNPECLSYGPGDLELAHKPNERVPVADLARVRAVVSQLVTDLF